MIDEVNKNHDSTEVHIKEKKSVIRTFMHTLFDLRDNMMSYEEIDAMMRDQTVIHGANMWILMLAILIASIGLNMNSTAVIIGAMLISPLMSGIMSMGYSVAVRDIPLLIKALVRFLTQVGICLLTSVMYFAISPLNTPTTEMIARTSPTVWDVMIAVFGGLAGMIGHTRTKHSNVIPGVAIATALMPPLCTAGYGIATAQPKFFLGAFYLFIINTLFIAISTAIVVLVLKVPYHKTVSDKAQHRANFIISVIAVAVIIPSVYVASYTVRDSYIDTNITRYLEKEFNFPETQLVKTNVDKQNKKISASVVGTSLSSEIINMLESRLSEYNLEGYSLYVLQNVFTDDDDENSDKLQIALLEQSIAELEKQNEEKNREIETLNNSLSEYIEESENKTDYAEISEKAEKIFKNIHECKAGCISDKNGCTAIMTATADYEISEYEIQTIESWLACESGTNSAKVIISIVENEEIF